MEQFFVPVVFSLIAVILILAACLAAKNFQLRSTNEEILQLKCDLEVKTESLEAVKETAEAQKKELTTKQSEIARLTTRLSFAQNLIPDINERIDMAIQEEEERYEQALHAEEERIKQDTIKRWVPGYP